MMNLSISIYRQADVCLTTVVAGALETKPCPLHWAAWNVRPSWHKKSRQFWVLPQGRQAIDQGYRKRQLP
ncbi:hypothetical protein PI125_g19421 [Phytophthora idaei]|nr:hypothetical protein PI125_g19421 [Phytophthora idaei]